MERMPHTVRVERNDAWGKRVNTSTKGVVTSGTSGKFTRGYTDHDQLDDLGLVHVNGQM